MNYYLGIDFGTSGARGIVIDREKIILLTVQYSFESKKNLALSWQTALYSLIEQIPLPIRQSIKAIAINGTSATVLLCDAHGYPVDEPILYNDGRGVTVLETIKKLTNDNQIAVSATSSLAKLIWWSKQTVFTEAKYFLHQADWLAFLIHGRLGISDYHNALKLGYDVERLCYPDWLQNLPFSNLLPQILAPGTIIDSVTPNICDRFSLSPDCLVCTGTTDSIAAFLASGASQPGEAVTSLGSTLVLKLLSTTKILSLIHI